jgi:hypothetical protein
VHSLPSCVTVKISHASPVAQLLGAVWVSEQKEAGGLP